jgi:putative PIN family toxin of toxin-antitoxin system
VYRVTLDTNIYISALEFGSNPLRLLEMAIDGDIEVATSQPIIDEVRRVLEDKFEWGVEELREAEALIGSLAHKVRPRWALDVVRRDSADNRVLECAMEAGSDFIVSGDKDLLRLKSFENTRMVMWRS